MKHSYHCSIATTFFCMMILTALTLSAAAQVPKKMNYQGILMTGNPPVPVTGTQTMIFSLYDVASGGMALWTETRSVTLDSAGRYSVDLGAVNPISLAQAKPYWLGVQIGTDSEMTPRKELTSAMYAQFAEHAQNINGITTANGKISIFGSVSIENATGGGKDLLGQPKIATPIWDVNIAQGSEGISVMSKVDENTALLNLKSMKGISILELSEWARTYGRTDPASIAIDTAIKNKMSKFIVTNDGNVGIGTTTPVKKLDIADGNIRIGQGHVITNYKNGALVLDAGPANAENVAGIWFRKTNVLGDESSYTNLMRITDTGNVGIGTTTPRAKLEIAGRVQISNPDGTQGEIYSENWDGGNFLIRGMTKHLSFYTAGGRIRFTDAGGVEKVSILQSGNVGIGTTNPTYKLSVNGTIRAKEIIVNTGWADFVFDKTYQLPSLSEVEQHISKEKHLPGIPSAQEVEQNGVSLGDMQAKQLQKIEELTLYVIQMNKQLTALQQENEELKAKLSTLEKTVTK